MVTACAKKQTGTPEEITEVLTGYFKAIEASDYQKMKDLTTADFIIFENGEVITNDSLINMIKKYPEVAVKYSFSDIKASVDDKTGFIKYRNHADIVVNDSIKNDINWLESAILIKQDDKWRLHFLHSTVKK